MSDTFHSFFYSPKLEAKLPPQELEYFHRLLSSFSSMGIRSIPEIPKMKDMPEDGFILFATAREMLSYQDQELDLPGDETDHTAMAGFKTGRGRFELLGFEDINHKYFDTIYKRYHNLPVKIFETERLLARELTVEDLDALYEVYSSPEVTEFVEPLYEDRSEELLFQISYIKYMYGMYNFGLWAIILKDTGKIIGRAGIELREIDGEYEIEIGYVFGRKYWGYGYAFEACKAVIDYAKNETDYPKINCLTRRENTASVNLAKKLGFTFEAETTIKYRGLDTVFDKYVLIF
ncbi:MAG: GNAT family N-acetyltransferase [Lachnospiraceae bacterium]|nr:GNAT family N-acetyltransferase [Lachnospiraceae bacterium]